MRSFLKSATRVLRLANKPGISELWLSIKICLLGVFVVGMLAFLIKFISSLIQGFGL